MSARFDDRWTELSTVLRGPSDAPLALSAVGECVKTA